MLGIDLERLISSIVTESFEVKIAIYLFVLLRNWNRNYLSDSELDS